MEKNLIPRYVVVGSKKTSNYIWAIICAIGGINFLLTGLSSYLNSNLLPIIHANNIIFFPQGLVMCFYGLLGIIFSCYLGLTILWSVGGGFNIFDKQNGIVRIFRWGFPGKNRRIDLTYPIDEVTAIRLELKDGLNPRRTIYLCVKGQRQIPLTRVGQPMTLEEIEILAAELAQFLQKDLV
uniref:Photosystem I assembly protein Ycf4 n=1 Tax=Ulva australis TaxID=111616 RepID=A0A6J4B7G2_9CHLO|nr:ycf4 protein [Ulva australis]